MRDFRTGAYRHRGAIASRRVTEPTVDVPGRCAARPGGAPRQPLVGRPRLPPARRRRDRRGPARSRASTRGPSPRTACRGSTSSGDRRSSSSAVYRIGGWTGLALLRAGLVGVIFGAILLIGLRRGLSPRNAALVTLGAFAVAAPALALAPAVAGHGLLRDPAGPRLGAAPPSGRVSGRSRSWCSSGRTSTAASSWRRSCWASPGSRTSPSAGAGAHRTLLIALVSVARPA